MFNYRPDRPVALRVTVELPTLRDRPQQPPVFDASHPGVDALLHPDRDGHRRIRRPFSSRSARTPTFPLLDGLDDVVAFALQVSRCAQIPDGVQMNVVQGFRCNLGKTGNLRGKRTGSKVRVAEASNDRRPRHHLLGAGSMAIVRRSSVTDMTNGIIEASLNARESTPETS
ncbi:hypothetical protein BDD14_0613 [Edaphobacter modestus]|uniref:Uncharacterized protein n=1 Tax=Edaphobacter modestus TaxID=388466 RepID=A0A4Q7YQ44_9BACT|nr:hypothetical protein BDD14_0613 [Edaphobacter modestus]